MCINDELQQWTQGGPSPAGETLRNPVEDVSELYLEMRWNLGVLLHYPHSPLAEDFPWGINFLSDLQPSKLH